MDTRFDQNQSEFGVFVLSVALQMLADGDSLLDQIVQIFWDVWSQAQSFQDPQDFVAADETHLSNTMRITKDDTCLQNETTRTHTHTEYEFNIF